MKVFCFDTETTDKVDFKLALDHPAQPNLVQLGGILFDDETGLDMCVVNVLCNDCGKIAPGAEETHGITASNVKEFGVPSAVVLLLFNNLVMAADRLLCHNAAFDIRLMRILAHRLKKPDRTAGKPTYCTMLGNTPVCKIDKPARYRTADDPYKWPSLMETYRHYFAIDFDYAHDALADVRATKEIYMAMDPKIRLKDNFTL